MVRCELWFLCSSDSTDINGLKLKLTHCTNLLFWLCTPAHLKRSGAAVHSLNNNNNKKKSHCPIIMECTISLCKGVCVRERQRELSCSISWVQMCPWWFWLASVFCQELQPGSLTQINTLPLTSPADAKIHSQFTSPALLSQSFKWIYAIIDLIYCIHISAASGSYLTAHSACVCVCVCLLSDQVWCVGVCGRCRLLESLCVGLFS